MLLSVSFCRHELWLSAPNVLAASIDRVRLLPIARECRIYCDRAVRSCGLAMQARGEWQGLLPGWVDWQAVRRFGVRLCREWFLQGRVPEGRDRGLPGGDRPIVAVFRRGARGLLI